MRGRDSKLVFDRYVNAEKRRKARVIICKRQTSMREEVLLFFLRRRRESVGKREHQDCLARRGYIDVMRAPAAFKKNVKVKSKR